MDLLLLGGVSGSGKSVALGALEDCGYYAVNNLPLPLVAATARYLADAGRDRVAIALDVKTAPGLAGLAGTIAELRALTWNGGKRPLPADHMFTTLRDVPRPGPVRPEITDRLKHLARR